MAEQEYSTQTVELAEHRAVGIIATEETTDAVIRTVLRAKEHGFAPLVTHYNTPDIEAIRYAARIGAKIVHPSVEDAHRDELRRELAATARALALTGIVYQPETGDPIDYERSAALLEEEFAIEAVPEHDRMGHRGLLVAIPAYNECDAIADVVREAKQHAETVLVVDDGSADATAERAADAGALVVEHGRNRGYGAALKTAFIEAERRNVETLVVLDGDGQHDPVDIPELVDQLEAEDATIAVGSRFVDGSETEMPAYRRFGIGIVNVLTNLSIGARPGDWITDTQSGFRAYDRDVIETIVADDAIGNRMEASTDILYHAHTYDYDIVETGTTVDYDVENGNTWNPVSHGMSLVNNILVTVERKHPILLLGVPGFVGTLMGVGFGYWAITYYITSGSFSLGLALMTSFFLLAGIFACFTAIILHSIQHHLA